MQTYSSSFQDLHNTNLLIYQPDGIIYVYLYILHARNKFLLHFLPSLSLGFCFDVKISLGTLYISYWYLYSSLVRERCLFMRWELMLLLIGNKVLNYKVPHQNPDFLEVILDSFGVLIRRPPQSMWFSILAFLISGKQQFSKLSFKNINKWC